MDDWHQILRLLVDQGFRVDSHDRRTGRIVVVVAPTRPTTTETGR